MEASQRTLAQEDRREGTSSVAPHAIDAEALGALMRGERRSALRTLMEGYGVSLYRYCYSILGSRTMTDDVHQSVLLQVYEGLGSFSGDSFRPWLYAIAHNRCMDALKVARRYEKRFSMPGQLPDKADESPSTEERIHAAFASTSLTECLGELKYHVRVAVVLRFQEGFSYEEMGRICRERPETLKMRVARSMPVLRKCLEGKGVLR
ncbi:RNA polymerase sigma factor [Chondromyces apiculatus]|uniref:RNA polymerase sigma factor n=1 Tax=Chondromyces apiculatus TaxID=51 RepID=UPI0009DF8CA6|nr:RNA polymerase sigma factor [Chondromyces apiculatus]